MGLALGMIAGATLWCIVLLAVTGWAGFGWLAAVFGLTTLASLFVNRPRRHAARPKEREGAAVSRPLPPGARHRLPRTGGDRFPIC